MPRGGSKPGERRGGRKKGTPNKRTLAINAAIATAETPLDFLLALMKNDKLSLSARMAAAKAAARYVHAPLAAQGAAEGKKAQAAAAAETAGNGTDWGSDLDVSIRN